MTHKQQAEQMVNEYRMILMNEDTDCGNEILCTMIAVKCALVAVNAIILSAPFEPVDTDWDEAGSMAQYWYPQKLEDSAKWWGEVKQEIENYEQ